MLFDNDIKQARNDKKPSCDIDRIEDTRRWELREFDGQIGELQTRYLLELAQKYLVPTPESADWEEDTSYGYRHLTAEAAARLRTAIRVEQKERWERSARWLPILGAITGVLGALVGVISVLRH